MVYWKVIVTGQTDLIANAILPQPIHPRRRLRRYPRGGGERVTTWVVKSVEVAQGLGAALAMAGIAARLVRCDDGAFEPLEFALS